MNRSAKKRTVLWVDDDPTIARSYSIAFQSHGIKIVTPNSLQDALEKAKDRSMSIDAIICDLYLDDSTTDEHISGIRFAELLRKSGSDVPIFSYTSLIQGIKGEQKLEEYIKNFKKASVASESSNPLLDAILGLPGNEQNSESQEDDKEAHEPRVIQLDAIDYALYQAIQEQPSLLKTLHWRAFEELLADILKTLGYDVELMCGTKDGGVDIIAIANATEFGPHKYLLQAKWYAHSVGVAPVRELMFLHNHHHVSKSCLATTAEFTKGAWELAHQYPWQLELRDFQGLHEWINSALKIKQSGYHAK